MSIKLKHDFLNIGQAVSINGNHWRGVIVDIAISEKGVIMVRVDSPKGEFYNTPPEWLPFIEGQIMPCTPEELSKEAHDFVDRLFQ